MSFCIDPQYSLSEMRERFNHHFPTVKMEWSFRGNEPLNHMLNNGKPFGVIRLGELFPDSAIKQLTIKDEMTIGEVENLFWKHFGLPVNLYIQKGGYWLKTTMCNATRLMELHHQ